MAKTRERRSKDNLQQETSKSMRLRRHEERTSLDRLHTVKADVNTLVPSGPQALRESQTGTPLFVCDLGRACNYPQMGRYGALTFPIAWFADRGDCQDQFPDDDIVSLAGTWSIGNALMETAKAGDLFAKTPEIHKLRILADQLPK
jgi:hypothetical protein